MTNPSPQSGAPSQGQLHPPTNQQGQAVEGYRGQDHPSVQHRDILQELIQSPKVIGHNESGMSQREREYPADSRDFDRYEDRSRDSYDYRKKDDSRDYERSRESSRDRDDRDTSREREKERRKKEAWYSAR